MLFRKCVSCGIEAFRNTFNEDRVCGRCVKTAAGNTEQLEVFGVDVILRVDGSAIVAQRYKKEESLTVPIANIQEFTLRPPWLLSVGGDIIIATAKPQSGMVGYAGSGLFMASSLSSKLTFGLQSPLEFEYAKEVQKYIAEFQANASASNSVPAAQFSVADELIKLKALLDDGVLTQEEFDRKKSKLLGE